ncbi:MULTISPECIES: MFS transporter [Psychrobacter]|uniref:Putative MFS family arabinose efflux permease n=1 Tax=Psychrobacter fozii TaxID=198480 RepID=A0A2V4UDI3_9GAMM|nr:MULTISPECIES: MFS transporter [Psychrobacter]PYE38237.1 putative MFS family arabinose efflux permease [Psychrobacter fozii]
MTPNIVSILVNNTVSQTQNNAPLLSPQTNSPSWVLKLTIGLIGMFAFLQVYSIQAVLPVLMVDFSATEVQAGMIVGATIMAIAIMSPFLGMLSDAVGRKPFIVGALLFLAIPTALIAQSPSIGWLGLWRFMQGLSVPGITVVTIAYIGEEFEGRAVTDLMSFYVSGCVLGGFLGRFLLGHLHELIGWRAGYYVMAAMTLVGAMWVGKMLPSSRQFVANPNFRAAIQTLGEHLTNRYVVTACLLGACVLFSLVGCFTFINLHLANTPYELSTGALANIFAVYLIGVVITPLSTNLLRRFGSARTVRVAIFISMIGVLLTLVTPLWGVVVGLAIMSSGVFVTQAATISYIAVNVKKGRSLASGLYYLGYYTGGTLGAWLCGIVYARGQWSLTVWLLVFVQILALLVASFGMVKTKSRVA